MSTLTPDTTPMEATAPQATTEAALPPAVPVIVTTTPAARPLKSPVAALLLSVFPGLGQIYNGQQAKGFVFFSVWVAAIAGAATIDAMPFGFVIPFVYFYNLIDAWRSAVWLNVRHAGGLEPDESEASPMWGFALVALGLVFLLNNLGWLDVARVARFWPVLLIGVGIYVLTSSRRVTNDAAR